MKLTKKLLTLLLTLALALSLTLPAMAAVNWDEFRITRQPQDLTIIYGESFTLSVEVSLPAGIVDVEYQWFRRGNWIISIQGATEPELRLSHGDLQYASFKSNDVYYCEITAYEKDGDGNELSSKTLTSHRVRVYAENKAPTLWESILGIILSPFVEFAMLFAIVVLPLLSAPYLWIKGLF